VLDLLRKSFRPEFLNRLDEIILFHKLSKDDLTKIVDVQVGHLEHLLADRNIKVEIDDKAKDWLSQNGFDDMYGARPLRRLIQREIQNNIAKMILAGDIKDGDTIKLSEKNGVIVITT
jgi:ATP-dependent Clp protease ATP-binding subunit ClpB